MWSSFAFFSATDVNLKLPSFWSPNFFTKGELAKLLSSKALGYKHLETEKH